MRRSVAILSLLLAGFALFSCKRSITGPGPKDPRTYTWTVDTIGSGTSQTLLFKVWGSGPRDVYAVGSGGVFHYNGIRWEPVVPYAELSDYSDIVGFSPNDIWIVGARIYPNPNPPPNFLDSSLILHFDRGSWRESQRLPTKGIRSVWGTSSTNLYAGSADGKILHYDGSAWSDELIRVGMQVISLGGDGNIIFAGGAVTTSFPDTQMIYANSGAGWNLVDQQVGVENVVDPRFGYSAIFSPKPAVIYSSTWGIFKWEANRWSRIIQSDRGLPDIGGSDENNIFVVGGGPVIWHWNGGDRQTITAATEKLAQDVVLVGVWVEGTEVFVVGTDGWRSYVLSGK